MRTVQNLSNASVVKFSKTESFQDIEIKKSNYGRWGAQAEDVVTFVRTPRFHQTSVLLVPYDVSF